MRQRVMIAMALDVTIQAQILDLLRQLIAERGTALVLITHDLGVVAGMCERVCVMYAGTVVEEAEAAELFASPRHPYTLGLLRSVPRLDTPRRDPLRPIQGAPRDMLSAPAACPFQPRCSAATAECAQSLPRLEEVAAGHRAACFHPAVAP